MIDPRLILPESTAPPRESVPCARLFTPYRHSADKWGEALLYDEDGLENGGVLWDKAEARVPLSRL